MYFVRVGLDWSEEEVEHLLDEIGDVIDEEALVVRSESFEAYETEAFEDITLNEEEIMERINEMREDEEGEIDGFLKEGTLNGME